MGVSTQSPLTPEPKVQTHSEMLHRLQKETFDYFLSESNPKNGLVRDKTQADSPASITATGFALAAYPVGVERGFLSRADAAARTAVTLRFFRNSVQDRTPEATGYKGFYYHFLDMETGRRVWKCELSTIDTTFLLAGALAAAAYFNADDVLENEIRDCADVLYRRADWRWFQNGGPGICLGWKPKSGFLKYYWQGYDESLLLHILALGSPTHPVEEDAYKRWTSSFQWRAIYGQQHLYAGPLFIHQLSHIWLDLRGIQDEVMQRTGLDYFENSRRATIVQQQYAIHNPGRWKDYTELCWGITASDGPGPEIRSVDGVKRKFFGYAARGVPDGPDDGTLAPWAVAASLPFVPEVVLPTLRHLTELRLVEEDRYGFKATFNPTFPASDGRKKGWVSNRHLGLNQGPIILMIENYRSGLLWEQMKRCSYVTQGLRRAGFRNGWLDAKPG